MSDGEKQKTPDIFEQLEEIRRNPGCIELSARVKNCMNTLGNWDKCQKEFDELVDKCYFQGEKRKAKERGEK